MRPSLRAQAEGRGAALTGSAVRVSGIFAGMPQEIADAGERRVRSGIVKARVTGPVRVNADGVEGDGQADRIAHGTPERALYAYPAAHTAAWAAEEARAVFAPGCFGENLSVDGMDEADVCVGDRLRLGGALLEATCPRIPCFKLGIRVGDASFAKRFLESRRTGFFFRVLEAGTVREGDAFARVAAGPGGFTMLEVLALLHGPAPDAVRLGEIASLSALPEGWRRRAAGRAAAARGAA